MDINSGVYISLTTDGNEILQTDSGIAIGTTGSITGPDSLLDVFGGARVQSLNINSAYTLPITGPVTSGDMIKYDGTNLVWGVATTAICPAGMTAAGANMCIETVERTASDWFDAAAACVASGYKLPTWAEWYGAASNAALTDETDDWEWVDGGTSNTVRKVGNGGLKNTANDDPDTGIEAFRCVYYLK
ncbi:MAG: hypothetical protein JKY48_12115 [Flavobacteriales bacterium]|nr:hypothetical protein [Flavobacteriales bacterium]